MNRYHVLTLFPEMIENGLKTSITGRAIENGTIGLNAINIRDFADNKHNKVDDYPYGGGAGMVMQAEPVYRAWASVTEKIGKKARTIYVTPQGTTFHQGMAEELAKEEDVIFLCGHYEGVDERVLEEIVTDYVSIGDYVLTGGEFPAMVMIDAISRLVPGVLNNEVSAEFESFQDGLLEYPQYSRPEVWHDKEVPPVLLSGNHTNIEGWRQELSILRTKERRPDLYETYREQQKEMQEKNKRKRRFKGVIFDMDGCLIDSERLYAQCWKMAFHKMGIPISDETLNSWNGIGGKELERAIESVTGEARLIPELRAIRDGYMAGALEDGRMPLMPYAKEIVTLAKEKGMTVGVASGTIRERAEKMLRFHGIYEMLDCTAFGNEVQAGKPAPDIYLEVARRLQTDPSSCMVFEDVPAGILAGKRAGMRVCAVEDAFSTGMREEKMELADFYIDDYNELFDAE